MSCAHPTCALAGRPASGDKDAAPCPAPHCTAALRLKRRGAAYLLGCSSAACAFKGWWLPKFVVSGKLRAVRRMSLTLLYDTRANVTPIDVIFVMAYCYYCNYVLSLS